MFTPWDGGGLAATKQPSPAELLYSAHPGGISPTGGGSVTLFYDDDGSKVGGGPTTPPPPAAPDYNAIANAAAKAQSAKENENTKALADSQFKLLDAFGKQRDIKLGNIAAQLGAADKLLLKNYGVSFGTLLEAALDNDKAEADSSFANIINASRERGDLMGAAAAQGAGESDLIKTQLQALRNFDANQNEVNRSYFDTLRSVNGSINSLNSDVETSRSNLYNQSESDKESAWANFYNQKADTWTQISNIENANSNVNSASSTAYNKSYANAAEEAAAATGSAYSKVTHQGLGEWGGRGAAQKRELVSSKPQAVDLSKPMKRPEGATLRKW